MLASRLSDAAFATSFRTLQSGSELLQARAFVHHYEQYGVAVEDIASALQQLEETVEAYKALRPA